MNKFSENKQNKIGGRIYFNYISIKQESAGGSKYWFLFVDEGTGFKKSYFAKEKSEIRQIGEKFLCLLEKKGINVNNFRCDVARENKVFGDWIEKSKFNVQMEYTGEATPQHNGVL